MCPIHPDDDARVFDRACVSLAEEGYDVHLVAWSERSDVYRNKGVAVHPVPKFGCRHDRIRGARRVARLIIPDFAIAQSAADARRSG